LAPDHPAGYIALGLSHDVAGRFSQGLAAYHEALARDPENGIAYANAAYNLFALGRLDASLEWNLAALERAPEIQFGMVQIANNLSLLGFDEEAGEWYGKVLALQPDNIFGEKDLLGFYLSRGHWREAQGIIDQGRKRGALSPAWVALQAELFHFKGEPLAALAILKEHETHLNSDGIYRMGVILAGEGQNQEAMQLLEPVEMDTAKRIDAGAETAKLRVIMAGIALAGGREEEALTWLQAAVDSGWRDHRLLAIEPAFAPLHDNPGYKVLLEDLRTRVAVMRARVEELGLLNQ
jgi:tetratricopeptide (TPR) repeat protein